MPWHPVEAMFAGIAEQLLFGGVFCLYNPMKYGGVLESQSNVEFDGWLPQQPVHKSIREFDDLNSLSINAGLMLKEDIAMPANNRLILWQKA
jgi:hypothetical protein